MGLNLSRFEKFGGRLILEFLAICFGVFLAFIMNDWRETRNHQLQADKALERLNFEIRDNYLELREGSKIVEIIYNKLTALAPKIDGSKGFWDYKKEFLGLARFNHTDSAWKLASSSATSRYLNYDYLEEVAALYDRHQFLENLNPRVESLILSELSQTPESAKTAYKIAIAIVGHQRQNIKANLKTYKRILKEYLPEIWQDIEKKIKDKDNSKKKS